MSHVAPHVGAWIEIIKSNVNGATSVSHPTWVRGLKLYSHILVLDRYRSHPTWVRGLKYPVLVRLVTLVSRTPRGCVD